jgi:hypothetical protein
MLIFSPIVLNVTMVHVPFCTDTRNFPIASQRQQTVKLCKQGIKRGLKRETEVERQIFYIF